MKYQQFGKYFFYINNTIQGSRHGLLEYAGNQIANQ